MDYEIVELEQTIVEGLMVRTTNQEGKAMQDIGTLWQQFFATGEYEKIQYKKNGKTMGLYTEYEGDYTQSYQFLTCSEVKKPSEDLGNRVVKVIPKGKYAKFVITGDVQKDVMLFWGKLWDMPLDRKYTCDFEEYQSLDENGICQEIHIYIAIKG